MPKIVTEQDKETLRNTLRQKAIDLIKEKGVANITVSDIANAAGIAKGTFYTCYNSKDEFFYSIISRAEKKVFEYAESAEFRACSYRERVINLFSFAYFTPDSIARYIAPDDLNLLARKNPEAYRIKDRKNDSMLAEIFDIPQDDMILKSLNFLMDSLQFAVSYKQKIDEELRRSFLNSVVDILADYLEEKRDNPNDE